MLFRASAPGSLMLMGEHAVLEGHHALVCAIDKRMTVIVSPRSDKEITITSALGYLETNLTNLTITLPFQFVCAVLIFFKKHLRNGCDIKIESEFSSTIGFASSSAVTVALLSALSMWCDVPYSEVNLMHHARKIIRSVQGLGSGADVAACVMGGMVAYRMRPFYAEKLAMLYPISVVYSGYKTPTVDVVKQVTQRFSQNKKLYQHICRAINTCVLEGIHAVKKSDWKQFGLIMNTQQGLMDALGVNSPRLADIVDQLREQPDILGAKISGSGLGDCVLGLGNVSSASMSFSTQDIRQIPVEMTSKGVYCEKI